MYFCKTTVDKTISRRRFLGALGLVALTGSTSCTTMSTPLVPATVRDFVRSDLFYIAHRGSGDNWPEHSLLAYTNARKAGANAIEISVHLTMDGVWVCHHDANLKRLTGRDQLIAQSTLHELQSLRLDARQWLGPGTPLEPIPTLEETLLALDDDCFIFIEDKTGSHTEELLQVLDALPRTHDRVVWKQASNGSGHRIASARGYLTWGYFAPDTISLHTKYAEEFDLLGVHDSASDDQITQLNAYGKPVICWEIHSRWQREHFQSLGIRGMMCSNFPYVANVQKQQTAQSDEFASGVRAAGDLPDAVSWNAQPKLQAIERSLQINGARKSSYVMGSMSEDKRELQKITGQFRWPSQHQENRIAGVSFNVPTDKPYRAFESSQWIGMHLQVETKGRASMWAAAGSRPELLASWNTAPIEARQWTTFSLEVTEMELMIGIDGAKPERVKTESNSLSGYFSLLSLVAHGSPLEFREIRTFK